MASCRACGRKLTELRAERRAIYCDGACRSAHFRRDKLLQAEHALELLREPPAPASVRAAVAAAGVPDPRGTDWRDRLQYLIKRQPTIVGSFGVAALTAAARPVPAGTCRWCLSHSYAVVHQLPEPPMTAASRRLLGPPCAACVQRVRAELARRVAAAATPTPTAAAPTVPTTTTTTTAAPRRLARSTPQLPPRGVWRSAPDAVRHAAASCQVCATALDGSATDAADLLAASVPHRPAPPVEAARARSR